MKKFPYKFSPTIILLFVLCFLLGIACVVLNIFRFINQETHTTYNYVTLICIMLVCIAFFVIGIEMIFNSCYLITDKELILKWGLLKNVIKLDSITKVIKNSDTNKVSIHYNEDNYILVVIKEEIFDDFTSALLKANDKIILEFASNPPKDTEEK